jgi:phospholipase/lecithinase/hemolysin
MQQGAGSADTASLGDASPPAFTALFAFGDSLSDAGNLYFADGGTEPVSPYYKGHFSNGPTWVEDLSRKLGLGTLTPSLAGGDDFAFGGAQTGTTATEGYNPIDLPTQIADYALEHPTPVQGALYTLDIGANDIINALDEYAAGKIPPGEVGTVVAEAETNTAHAVEALYLLGARNLLFYEVPNLGLTPLFRGTPLQGLASGLALSFDETVLADLSPLERFGGLKVYDLNTFGLLDDIVGDPSAYGFSNVTDPVWSGNFTSSTSGTLVSKNRAVQNTYLFWDELHPTEAGQRLAATLAYDELAGRTSSWTTTASGLAAAPAPYAAMSIR